MTKSFEIRVHGRGGQGGVTCAKILAACYAQMDLSVQTFGDYAGERSGAPVRAYTRVSDEPITNRNKVYNPDQLLVLDPTLLGDEVVYGLAPGGSLLLNTPDTLETFEGRFEEFEVAVLDATAIARRRGIGTRSVVIVNTTIAGAYAKIHGVSLDVLEKTYQSLGLEGNFAAAREAYDAVKVRPSQGAEGMEATEVVVPLPPVDPLTEHLTSPPTGLQTGSWSTQMPEYVDHLAPCSAFCPAGNDVIGFVRAVGISGEAKAAEILGESTPLAAVCGRVCPAPCMEGCNRREYDGSVNIRGLERWIADREPVAVKEVTPAANPFRIAIVGGGPAGLGAAYELAKAGHQVTIFEGEKELGGVLRTGIPVYRLPREVLDQEVNNVLALGVEARCGTFLDAEGLAALESEYDAMIFATGLQWLRGLKAPGAELDGIEQGIGFLHRMNLEGGVKVSGHVVVLGGGNTAMDCARSALRAGAEKVTVAYRRTHKEMPAIREEIVEAENEGIVFLMQRQPVGFFGDGAVQGIELAEVEMGEPDDSGRRRPNVTDRTSRFECDQVLLALGQGADLDLLPQGWELRGNRLHDGDKPLKAFGAGDVSTGDGTVTHAIGDGRKIAGLVLRELGVDFEVFERPDRKKAIPVTDIRLSHFPTRTPVQETLEMVKSRVTHFEEVNQGLPDNSESGRCFSCGHCTHCDTCLIFCPEGIIRRADHGYAVDLSYCKGCGICVEECPREAMEMKHL
jgi:2-oxoacid:acceptor oxidoreductase gamma subunit (pyruvate/2-ketoisovalerate family)